MSEHTPNGPTGDDPGSFRADVEVIAAFARTAEALAGRVDLAVEHTRSADPAALTPILGVVGAGFLATFTEAHRRHEADLVRIGATLSGMGSVAGLTAASYRRAEDEFATRVQSAGGDA